MVRIAQLSPHVLRYLTRISAKIERILCIFLPVKAEYTLPEKSVPGVPPKMQRVRSPDPLVSYTRDTGHLL